MHALVGAYSERKLWQRRHGSLAPQTVSDIMADERHMWAIAQKDVKGLFVVDAEMRDRLRRQGVEPNAWIWPSKMTIYASMVPSYQTEFQRNGEQPMGPTGALTQGEARFASFRGLPVLETSVFDVDFLGESGTDPLKRPRQVGEYAVMHPLCKSYRDDVHIYDMNQDRFVHVGLSEAMDYSMRFSSGDDDRAGRQAAGLNCTELSAAHTECWRRGRACYDVFKVNDNAPGPPGDGLRNASNHMQIRHMCGWLSGRGRTDGNLGANKRRYFDDLVPRYAGMYVTPYALAAAEAAFKKIQTSGTMTPCTLDRFVLQKPEPGYTKANFILGYLLADVSKSNFSTMLEHDISPPVAFILCRPWCTYQMGTAIMVRGGTDLGITAHGHHDFQLADDAIHKVHIGHYTFYSRSIVKDSKLMAFADDVYSCGYHGGEETNMCDRDAIQQHIQSSQITKNTPSIVSLLCAIPFKLDEVEVVHAATSHRDRVTLAIPNPLSVHGRIPGTHRGTGISPDGATLWTSRDFLTHAVGDEWVERMDANHGGDDSIEPFVGSNSTISEVNSLCFQAQQQDSHGNVTICGTGHWGTHCYDGCGAARTGNYCELSRQDKCGVTLQQH